MPSPESHQGALMVGAPACASRALLQGVPNHEGTKVLTIKCRQQLCPAPARVATATGRWATDLNPTHSGAPGALHIPPNATSSNQPQIHAGGLPQGSLEPLRAVGACGRLPGCSGGPMCLGSPMCSAGCVWPGGPPRPGPQAKPTSARARPAAAAKLVSHSVALR